MTVRIGISLPMALGGLATDPRHSPVTTVACQVEEHELDSLWVPDLLLGEGTPALEPMMTLAAAAAVTRDITIGSAVLSVPLRPLPWLATQVGTLQYLSGDRFVLGVGLGGFPGVPFWQNLGAGPTDRGPALDRALDLLPHLTAGESVTLDPQIAPLQMGPPTPMPPVLVGGSERAFERILAYGADWLPSLISPQDLAPAVGRLNVLAAERDLDRPGVTVGGHVIIGADRSAADAYDALVASLIAEHRMAPEVAARAPMRARSPAELAEVFAEFQEAGAGQIIASSDNKAWSEQLEFIAEARALLR